MIEDEQVLHDDLEKMIAQEVVATALDDATRQAFEEEKRNIASQKRAAQTTSITKLSTSRSFVSTVTTPYVSAASTSTADLEDDSDAFSSDGIFNGAYDDENVGVVADFNNMDDTINVSPIPTLRIHKNHPKDQILGDPKFSRSNKRKDSKVLTSTPQSLEVYVHQPPGFLILLINKVYKVTKALYGLHQAPRAWYETLSSFLRKMVQKRIYVADLLKKFDILSIRTSTTPIRSNKPLGHRMNKFQVTPKASHLNAVKRIFRYLKHQPKLGLWYPRDSPFKLEAFSDSDYGGASLDRKSTIVSTTFVEQFWMSAKSKIINNVRYITAKVAGKPVNISEASIRSDLLFDDADGIDSLHNQAIFDAIQLMGYEGDLTVLTFNKALFSPQWRFLFHTMNHCISSKSTSWDQIPTNIATTLKNVPVPLDHFPINALTSKVFSFMVKKGKHFSGNVTPLFKSMLVQPTEDEGEASERQSEPQPTPSPPHPSADQHETQPDPSPRPSPTIPIPDSNQEMRMA
ncbi:putative ribonuclease H-like domain-containing protein [Tanacetum coccineum]